MEPFKKVQNWGALTQQIIKMFQGTMLPYTKNNS